MNNRSELPYRIPYPWSRILGVPLFSFGAWLTFLLIKELVGGPETNAYYQIFLFVSIVAAVYAALFVLFCRTILLDDRISHINPLFRTKNHHYSEIQKIEITPYTNVKLTFRNGDAITIQTGVFQVRQCLTIIKPRLTSPQTIASCQTIN